MSKELEELLRTNAIFSSLNQDDHRKLIAEASCRDFKEGQWIAHYGDVWPYLFIIEYGAVTALKESSEGRSLLIAKFDAGDIFWGLSFFLDGAPTPAGLVAAKACRIHLWSKDCILPILLENGSMSWELTLLMVRRMLLASNIVEGLAFQPVAGRLATWLLENYAGAIGETVSRDVTLDEMAAHIGSTREIVCRALYRFAEEGAIQINRTEFMINDSAVLEKYMAKGK